ncbi:MAG: hypothetical protein KJZ80_14535 [Hyphomicrobiaceae bacterium]|nr:hypothetical protein [Hyphomicrobiaceae bacterium]
MDGVADTALLEAAERIPDLVNACAPVVRRGRWLTAEFLLEIGDVPYHVSVESGRIRAFERGPLLMRSWTFAIHADAEGWREHWRPLPRPGFHDIFAMAKCGLARIQGDLRPLMANLLYVKDVLAAPRCLAQ